MYIQVTRTRVVPRWGSMPKFRDRFMHFATYIRCVCIGCVYMSRDSSTSSSNSSSGSSIL